MEKLVSLSGREFLVFRNSGSVSVFEREHGSVVRDLRIPCDVVEKLVAAIIAAKKAG